MSDRMTRRGVLAGLMGLGAGVVRAISRDNALRLFPALKA